MKRIPVILLGVCLAVVSVFQYRLIVSSLLSFAAWCMLLLIHPDSFRSFWKPELVEYWLAGIVWITALVWVSVSIFHSIRPGKNGEGGKVAVLSGITRVRRWSVRAIGLTALVALTSPFLAPVDPNVQGSLVATRLLPPLSVGYVREYLEPESFDVEVRDRLYQTFVRANHYLLHRRVSLSGDPAIASPPGFQQGAALVREFRTVFLFGTDDNARDVFSRAIAGTRVSLGIGISTALGALLIGAAIGFSAGMSRGILDGVLMRLTDLFLAIPSLFLVIGVLAFVGRSVVTIVLVLSLSGWMGIARVVRGEVVSLREREFILAARLLRVSTRNIVSRHLIPNLRPVIFVGTVLQFANAVLGEAALGFLGLGIPPPTATWGNMMGEATGYLSSAWWVGMFPGLFLALVIVSAHSIGESSIDPDRSNEPQKQLAG